jgi:hypothetical protein
MAVRRFAALVGILFLMLGLLGFIFKHLFGIFHLDTTQNVIHLIFGLLGLLAAFDEDFAYRFSQVLGIVYMVLAVFGVLAKDVFGLMHAGVAENVLHFVVGAIALFFGYVISETAARSRTTNSF